jgi:hypothetical protein
VKFALIGGGENRLKMHAPSVSQKTANTTTVSGYLRPE